eukprot:jgi/Psemu1/54281/gm1.54281_g
MPLLWKQMPVIKSGIKERWSVKGQDLYIYVKEEIKKRRQEQQKKDLELELFQTYQQQTTDSTRCFIACPDATPSSPPSLHLQPLSVDRPPPAVSSLASTLNSGSTNHTIQPHPTVPSACRTLRILQLLFLHTLRFQRLPSHRSIRLCTNYTFCYGQDTPFDCSKQYTPPTASIQSIAALPILPRRSTLVVAPTASITPPNWLHSHFGLPGSTHSMPPPTSSPASTVGRASASSPKKRLQSTPSLSSSSARSSASGSRYPKRAHLKKSSTPPPAPTQATPSPSSLRPRKDASLSACSSSLASQSSVTSMSVSSSDSSVASSTQSAKKPATPRDSKQPALKSPPLQPPALKQLVLTPSALQQPTPSAPLPAPAPALKQSLLPQSPSLTPSPSLDCQALRKQALAAANQAHSASFLWRFYGDGRFPTPSFIHRLRKSPAQSRVWNASPSPTHFFSKKDGRDKKSIHDVCRLSIAPVYALVNPADSDWRTATVESLVSLASACFQGSAAWTKSPPGQALRKCLIGLAKMSPECFDALYCEGNLLPSTEGLVWLSANRVLGSHWFFKTKPPVPDPSAASASSTPAPGSRSYQVLLQLLLHSVSPPADVTPP